MSRPYINLKSSYKVEPGEDNGGNLHSPVFRYIVIAARKKSRLQILVCHWHPLGDKSADWLNTVNHEIREHGTGYIEKYQKIIESMSSQKMTH